MAVENLEGTRWIFKDSPTLLQTASTFNIETVSLNGGYSPPLINGDELRINSASISVYGSGLTTTLYSGSWRIRHKIIDFGAGVDSTNQTLIDWVSENAEEISMNYGRSKWIFNDILTLPNGYNVDLYCRSYVINESGNKIDEFIYLKTSYGSLVYNTIIDEYTVYSYGYWYMRAYNKIALLDEYITDLELYGFLLDNASEFVPSPPYNSLPDPDEPIELSKPEFAPYSITFFDRESGWYTNSFSDLNMVPEERPIVEMPEKKVKTLEIPGANGVLDLSDMLTGWPLFNNREGEFSFYILNNGLRFEEKKSKIIRSLHGRRRYMMLNDDKEFYYFGSFSVGFENDDSLNHAKCIVSYSLNPFKTKFDSEFTQSVSTGLFSWKILAVHEEERYL